MTKKEFKQALLRGQGRCIQAVRAQPERYRSVIMWACAHETAYDVQCEGSRAWFVHQLIQCYPDQTTFLDEVIEHLDRAGDCDRMDYPAELLYFFARDGEKRAEEALWRKYEEWYRKLADRRKSHSGRDSFAWLCWLLAKNKSAAIKIAEDIGGLYRKGRFSGFDFDWLYEGRIKKHQSALTRQAGKSADVAEYLKVSQAWEKEQEERRGIEPKAPPQWSVGFSLWMKRHGSREEILRCAEDYLEQADPEARAKALLVFSRCPFPGDPDPVVEDAVSDFELLRNAAWAALENICHPAVREFALANLEDHFEDAWPVFLMNYQPKDGVLAAKLLKSVPVKESEGGPYWHGIQCVALAAADWGVKLPGEILSHIYETTRCSCCRRDAVRQMGRRRLLNNEILEECIFDSHRDIRAYAKQRLAKVRG